MYEFRDKFEAMRAIGVLRRDLVAMSRLCRVGWLAAVIAALLHIPF